MIAVTLTGCLRFGYDVQQLPAIEQADAGAFDASVPAAPDASLRDGPQIDAAPAFDAGQPYQGDAALLDASAPLPDAATAAADGGGPVDAASSAPTDAAVAVDAAVPTSGPCLTRTDLTFCSSFEDSEGWSSPTEFNGTLRRTTAEARTGASSLHGMTGPPSSGKLLRQQASAFMQQTIGDVWARAWLRLPSSTIIDATSALVALSIAEGASPYFGCAVAIRSTQIELIGVPAGFAATLTFPRDQWTCVELHIQIDGDTGLCEAYVDMSIAAQSAQTDTLPASGYSTLAVGLEISNALQTPVDLYFDDVATGPARIYCN